MGVVTILVMWPGPFEQTFCSRVQRGLHMKYELNWPSGFRGEKCMKMLTDWRTDDIVTVYYKLTHEPSAQVS